jgi:hypothetical protein
LEAQVPVRRCNTYKRKTKVKSSLVLRNRLESCWNCCGTMLELCWNLCLQEERWITSYSPQTTYRGHSLLLVALDVGAGTSMEPLETLLGVTFGLWGTPTAVRVEDPCLLLSG